MTKPEECSVAISDVRDAIATCPKRCRVALACPSRLHGGAACVRSARSARLLGLSVDLAGSTDPISVLTLSDAELDTVITKCMKVGLDDHAPAVACIPGPPDESRLFQPIDDAGDGGDLTAIEIARCFASLHVYDPIRIP